jgi:Peptidase family M23
MKQAFLLLSIVLLQTASNAQRIVDVSYSLDKQGRYIFICNNRDYCNYILHLDFTTLVNANADHALPYEAEVKPGINKLLILTPLNKTDDTKVNFKSSYRKGCLSPVVNAGFVYLLPIAPGLETQAYIIPNAKGAASVPGGQDSGFAVRLRAKMGDTIYAARRGIVTVVDVSNTENDAGATTTSNWNYVEIAQADCSFAQYGVLKKDGAFVKPGQTVEAGTPIGLVGGDRYGRGSDVRFSVSYYPGVNNTQIPLLFWTKGNGKGPLRQGATYLSEFPKTLLTQELPKKPKPSPRQKHN